MQLHAGFRLGSYGTYDGHMVHCSRLFLAKRDRKDNDTTARDQLLTELQPHQRLARC